MASDGELGLVLLTVSALLITAVWTDRRYRRFDMLPAHYDFRGRPTRFASRRLMAWLLPVTFSVMLVVIVFAIAAVPPELQNGDSFVGTLALCLTLLGAQALVLWLQDRWSRSQG